jgi:hypothetical protein
MLWLKIVAILLGVVAVVCACYDFHLHLIDAPRQDILDMTVLTLFFCVMSTGLGVLENRFRRK